VATGGSMACLSWTRESQPPQPALDTSGTPSLTTHRDSTLSSIRTRLGSSGPLADQTGWINMPEQIQLPTTSAG
jgi:hypothetical protein